MGMDQYLLILFLGEWTSIYQLFWCSPGVQGFDTLPYVYIMIVDLEVQVHAEIVLYKGRQGSNMRPRQSFCFWVRESIV